MRKTCLEMIYEFALRDERIFFIGSDLGFGTLKKFKDRMNDRFFMEGVSEANIIGMASGLAMEGKIPYVNTIASFLTRRCFEQIVLDLCLPNLKVRLIGNGGGLVYAPLGPTHTTVEDIAIMRAVPNMTVIAPADAEEMSRLMPATVDHPGPIYIRLAKGADPIVCKKDHVFSIGKAVPMRSGGDALIITTGIALKLALASAEELHGKGIGVSVLHMPTIKPLDIASILEYAEKAPVIVTVEEHSIAGGFGSSVAEVITEADFRTPKYFRRLGIPDVFPDEYGSQVTLMEKYSLTSGTITTVVMDLIEICAN